jgi:hypothetical protein
MIVFDPPLALPFIPPTQKIARVALVRSRDELRDVSRLGVILLDEKGARISPDPASMPGGGRFTTKQAAAVEANEAGLALDTPDRTLSRAALSLVHELLGVTSGGRVA